MQQFRRLDRAWARIEGALMVGALLSMVFVASFSAAIRNLTHWKLAWANALLADMEWVDGFLHKATLWLAFLGASQAAYYRKHISVEALNQNLPRKQRYALHAAAGLIAAGIVFALVISTASAIGINLRERPVEYEVVAGHDSLHVCDASPRQLAALQDAQVPSVFCVVRGVFGALGVRAEAPGALFQLIVPLTLLVIGLRFTGAGVRAARAVASGDDALAELEAEARAQRMSAQAAADAGSESTP